MECLFQWKARHLLTFSLVHCRCYFREGVCWVRTFPGLKEVWCDSYKMSSDGEMGMWCWRNSLMGFHESSVFTLIMNRGWDLRWECSWRDHYFLMKWVSLQWEVALEVYQYYVRSCFSNSFLDRSFQKLNVQWCKESDVTILQLIICQ